MDVDQVSSHYHSISHVALYDYPQSLLDHLLSMLKVYWKCKQMCNGAGASYMGWRALTSNIAILLFIFMKLLNIVLNLS